MIKTQTAIAAVLATAAASASALPTAFASTDLNQIVADYYGTALRSFSTEMLGLNNLGQVLGRAITDDDLYRSFLIANGALTEIGTHDGSRGISTGIFGYGLNNLGDVVGQIVVAGTGTQRLAVPALYKGGSVSQLNVPFTSGFATAIGDTGHIAGYRYDSRSNFLLRSDGSYAEFLQGRGNSSPDINSAGAVVGNDNPWGRGSLGYIFNGTSLTYPLLPSDPAALDDGSFGTVIAAINDAGQIAATVTYAKAKTCYATPEGDVCDLSFTREAGTAQGGTFAPVPGLLFDPGDGTLSYTAATATGINNRGTLIGHDDHRNTAFLSDGTTTVTLNDPRRIGSSNFYGSLYAINDADQLLGRVGGSDSPWVLLDPLGVNAQAPLLPAEQAPGAGGGTTFTFTVFVASAAPLFFDPDVAIGYEYEVQSGPSIASVLLPDLGDGTYRLELWDGSAWVDAGFELEAGVSFDLLAGVSAEGVRKFRIVGIETDVALDPSDPNAFVTGLTFIGSGELKLTQTSLTVNVPIPEPSTYAMFIAGLGLMLVARKRVDRLAAVKRPHDPGNLFRVNQNIVPG